MHYESRILFLPDARVATKRGITAGYKTIISQDPRIRLMEQYATVVARIFEEHWPGMGKEFVLPIAELKAAAAASGLPESVSYHIFRSKRDNFFYPIQ